MATPLPADEKLRYHQLIVPLIPRVLRELRAQGAADPVAALKQQYDSGDLSAIACLLNISPILAVSVPPFTAGDFNDFVNAAALQL